MGILYKGGCTFLTGVDVTVRLRRGTVRRFESKERLGKVCVLSPSKDTMFVLLSVLFAAVP